jgi:hypothetical protein
MTLPLAISTFFGGFIFTFVVRLCWGKFIEDWGPIGGWMAAGFIVGTSWCLTHGVGMIHQMPDSAWIDQAYATGFGLLIASKVVDKVKLSHAMPHLICAIIGGIMGGYILSTFV